MLANENGIFEARGGNERAFYQELRVIKTSVPLIPSDNGSSNRKDHLLQG